MEEILAGFDRENSSKFGSAEWLRFLLVYLQQFLLGSSNNSSKSGIQNSMTLAVRRRYGSEVLTSSVSLLFRELFDEWCGKRGGGGGGEGDKEEEDEKEVGTAGELEEQRGRIIQTLQCLNNLSWFKMYRTDFMSVLHFAIKEHIHKTCKDDFETFFIPQLKVWLRDSMLPFVNSAVGQKSGAEMQPLLAHSLLKAMAETRAQELFNMVADFPESIRAVKELKEAMSSTGTLSVVGKEFKAAVKKRLLHVGASTTQIVGFYVSMIRALRVMDSSDLLLNFVAAPVRLYLKGRKDTVRCVVSALTEGKGSELHGELRKGGSLEYGPDEDDEDGGPGENWEPRRRNPDLAEAGSRGLDVLALLVSIYGSTDLFVSDYRSVLADKLLMTNLDCRADQELVTLELLKIRFGEEALHCCEVMLRDLEESRRTNAMLLQQQQRQQQQRHQQQQRGADEEEDEVPFDCLIVSEHYWPALQSDPLTLPPRIAKSVASYQSAYATAKKPRKLHVVPQLGLVDIDLEFDDGSVRNFLVTPVQASLAMFLAEEGGGGLTLPELAAKSELEESDVARRMGFWVAREIVRETREMAAPRQDMMADEEATLVVRYIVVEEQANRGNTTEGSTDEVEQMTVGSDVTEKAALVQFETFVKGLLTNHGTMSLERIHTMLKLIASGGAAGGAPRFDMNLVQLQKFLQLLIDQDKIESGAEGHYRIRAR